MDHAYGGLVTAILCVQRSDLSSLLYTAYELTLPFPHSCKRNWLLVALPVIADVLLSILEPHPLPQTGTLSVTQGHFLV